MFLLRVHGKAFHRAAPYCALALLLSSSAGAQELASLTNRGLLSDNNGIATLLAFAVSIFLIIILTWLLQRALAKRRQFEVNASEDRNRLNAILNNAGVGILLIDRHARHVDVNRRWCRMFGYQRREARGKLSTRDISHPDEAEAIQAHFDALLAGEIKSDTQERRFIRKDGSVFWGLLSTSTVENKTGQRMWVVGMITDIDAQKQIEEALRESEERLRFITENTHDIVWQLDRDLRFTYINSADQRMRGYRRDEVIGQHFRDLITPAGQLTADHALQQQAAADEAANCMQSFEVEMHCKDGSRVWAEINSTPIRDHGGQISGHIGVTRDATQRHATQEKLREQSIRDPLTGLFNRRYLDESLERELVYAKREQLPLALLMIDIDHFKRINDTHGHQAGDEVIKRLGELIRKSARNGDLPYRYGGEEFLLVLPNMSLETAGERAEQWRCAFASERIDCGQISLSATLSVGVAAFPEHGCSREQLIEAADQALYAAKHAGRNRVAVAA